MDITVFRLKIALVVVVMGVLLIAGCRVLLSQHMQQETACSTQDADEKQRAHGTTEEFNQVLENVNDSCKKTASITKAQ